MDLFEWLTGFREVGYAKTLAQLRVVDCRFVREGKSESYNVRTLTLPSVAELRLAAAAVRCLGRLRLDIVEGDVRALNRPRRTPARGSKSFSS